MQKTSKILSFFVILLVIVLFLPVQARAYYNNMSASVVIGQANFSGSGINQGGNVGPNTLNTSVSNIVVGNKLIVADYNNNRVLIWNQIPTVNNASADVVLGQTSFTTNTANQGLSTGPTTLNHPDGLASDGTKLFVSDRLGARILIYNQIPTSNNTPADLVIGQASLTAGASGCNQNNLSVAAGVAYDSKTGKIAVHDNNNSRVLIWNQVPTTNGVPADVVVGQVDFTHCTSNQGGSVGANTLAGNTVFPGVSMYDGKLMVADRPNHRVLIWNQIPTVNNAPADVVIGQADFTHNSAHQGGAAGPNTLSGPLSAHADPQGRLFIGEAGSARVLIFNQIPTSNNASADVVLGQQNFTGTSIYQGGSTAAANFVGTFSEETTFFPNGIIVNDAIVNNRLLIFYNDSTAPGLSVGQPQSAENNLVKLTGNASTITNYTIKSVQYMVNGGGFNGATATDGSFDSAAEPFWFTFDPKSNNNTNDGYTVQIKSTTSNADTTDHLFFFQPFNLNSPDDRSFISKSLPAFSFSVNKQQTQLKENLSKYRLMVKKSGGEWVNYVDNIPVDYNSVQSSADNLQPSTKATNGNGTYEDKKILVVYSNNNSSISVTPKAVDDQGNSSALSFDQSGKLLNNGGYEWKVQAVDKNGHIQETETRKFVVGSSQFSNGSNWFPLQINSISGLGRVYLSTISPQLIKPKYRIQTSNPIFKGIATANSTVQLDLTNQTCQTKDESNCVQTFTANSNGTSQFSLATSANALKSGNIYQAQFSVSQNGLFNALPPFQITR